MLNKIQDAWLSSTSSSALDVYVSAELLLRPMLDRKISKETDEEIKWHCLTTFPALVENFNGWITVIMSLSI